MADNKPARSCRGWLRSHRADRIRRDASPSRSDLEDSCAFGLIDGHVADTGRLEPDLRLRRRGHPRRVRSLGGRRRQASLLIAATLVDGATKGACDVIWYRHWLELRRIVLMLVTAAIVFGPLNASNHLFDGYPPLNPNSMFRPLQTLAPSLDTTQITAIAGYQEFLWLAILLATYVLSGDAVRTFDRSSGSVVKTTAQYTLRTAHIAPPDCDDPDCGRLVNRGGRAGSVADRDPRDVRGVRPDGAARTHASRQRLRVSSSSCSGCACSPRWASSRAWAGAPR